MSDTPLSDIDLKNKMVWVPTTLKKDDKGWKKSSESPIPNLLLIMSVNKSCLEFELFLFSSLDGAVVVPTFFSGVVFDSLEIFLSLASSILAMIDSKFRFLDFWRFEFFKFLEFSIFDFLSGGSWVGSTFGPNRFNWTGLVSVLQLVPFLCRRSLIPGGT